MTGLLLPLEKPLFARGPGKSLDSLPKAWLKLLTVASNTSLLNFRQQPKRFVVGLANNWEKKKSHLFHCFFSGHAGQKGHEFSSAFSFFQVARSAFPVSQFHHCFFQDCWSQALPGFRPYCNPVDLKGSTIPFTERRYSRQMAWNLLRASCWRNWDNDVKPQLTKSQWMTSRPAKRCQKNNPIAVKRKNNSFEFPPRSLGESWEILWKSNISILLVAASAPAPPCLRVVPATNRNVPEDPCQRYLIQLLGQSDNWGCNFCKMWSTPKKPRISYSWVKKILVSLTRKLHEDWWFGFNFTLMREGFGRIPNTGCLIIMRRPSITDKCASSSLICGFGLGTHLPERSCRGQCDKTLLESKQYLGPVTFSYHLALGEDSVGTM